MALAEASFQRRTFWIGGLVCVVIEDIIPGEFSRDLTPAVRTLDQEIHTGCFYLGMLE